MQFPFPVKFIASSHAPFFGLIALMLGVAGLIGWQFGMPELTAMFAAEVPMPINTALCFALAGAALLLQPFLHHAWARRIRLIFGSAIVVICAIMVLAFVFHAPWMGLDSGQKSPWKMDTASIFGLGLAGFLLIAADKNRNPTTGKVVQICTAAIGIAGVVGILSYVMNLDYLYVFPNMPRIAFSTAGGLIAVALGIWCIWSGAPWNVGKPEEVALHHIYQTVDILLTVIVAAVSLVVFGLSQDRSEKLMREHMSVIAKDRRVFFEDVLKLHMDKALQISSRPQIILFVRKQEQTRNSSDSTLLVPLVISAKSFLSNGFSALAYLGPSSEILTSQGQFVVQPETSIPIAGRYPSELMWKDGFVLRTRMPLADDAGLAGYVLAEQPLAELTRLHHDALRYGETGDMAVCGPSSNDQQKCFPFRWTGHAAVYPAYLDGKPLPLTRAGKGETATDITTDFRRQRVMVALGPIGGTGLGMGVKMDMWELYAPIRKQFFIALPFLGLLVAASIWLMRVRLHPLVAALEKSRRDLAFSALHDSLTGVPNRLMFNDRLTQAVLRAKRSKNLLAVMYLDLDHFKNINDTFGHQTGDEVLQTFAAQLQKAVRASDTVARLGGDEFTIILENLSSKADAERIAQSIQKSVQDPSQFSAGSPVKRVGASIGIAFYQGDQTEPEQLLQRADAALYHCKQQGRGHYQIASEA